MITWNESKLLGNLTPIKYKRRILIKFNIYRKAAPKPSPKAFAFLPAGKATMPAKNSTIDSEPSHPNESNSINFSVEINPLSQTALTPNNFSILADKNAVKFI